MNTRLLTEIESKELLRKAGIPVIEARLARTAKESIGLSRQIGFPVVMKIASPDIVHKSDVGGVKLGLANAAQASRAYREIISAVRQKIPQARIEGMSIQKMARPGVELIIGMSQDPQFGPVLMFGLGGVLVEIIKDVSFRLVPVTPRDAGQMIKEIKGFPLLEGYRGSEPVDIGKLQELIVKISGFIENNPQIQELDLNPVYGYRDSVIAVDARIVIED
ncbi:MAG TPA: acetate--CoA ligase family protein [Dehalococcoidales bacterium]